ncbi:amidohydrolase [Variovorax sp. VNK109]|uniref:amidohydrolase n=1 Tax=Variovorax sp. VNK109 TaxID=3400919 RepID=UPI003C0AC239
MGAVAPETRRIDAVVLGNIRALDAKGTRAQALAIRDGRIVSTGDADDVLALADTSTRVHDHTGRTVVPGFNDTHAHMDSVGLLTQRPSLQSADSVEAILQRVRTLAASTPVGEWIVTMPVGRGPFYFEQTAHLRERRMPTRQELDAAAPNHPVYITAPSGYWGKPPCHAALNSRGLALNGIDRHTQPRVPGVRIEKDDSGEPTGVIADDNYPESAQLDVLPAVPRFSHDERKLAIRLAQAEFHSVGTTSIYEGHGLGPRMIGHYRQLHHEGLLTMRAGLVVNPLIDSVAQARDLFGDWLSYAANAGLGDDTLRISGVYIGFGGDKVSAVLAQRAPDDIGWSSHIKQAWSEEEFEQIARIAQQCGLRVHTVAADNIEKLLPVLERLDEAQPIGPLRWVVEHLGACSPSAVQRLRRLGVAVTLIPAFHIWKASSRYLHLDDAAQACVVPALQLIDAGVPVSMGSDAVPHNPLFNVWALATRHMRESEGVLGPQGRLDVEKALRLATTAGAWLTFDEDRKGALVPGHFADMAVLSHDPCEVAPEDIPHIRCEATLVGGRVVYRRGAPDAA